MRSHLECRECSEIEAAFASPAIGRSMHLDIQVETNVGFNLVDSRCKFVCTCVCTNNG